MSHTPSVTGRILHVLRRLSPENPSIVSYIMILAALVPFVLAPPRDIAPWEFYGTVLCLSGMLALAATDERIEARYNSGPLVLWGLVAVNTLLFLGAFIMGASGFGSFIPFLAFMLVGQVTLNSPLHHALIYTLVLIIIIGVLVVWTSSIATASLTLTSMIPGAFFTMVFTLLARRSAAQTAHTEALLVDLQRVNQELEASRTREQELAAAEERVRVARDIHDGIGHHLTVLNIQLQAAEKLIHRDPQRAEESVKTAREVAQAALEEVRQSVATLRRTPLDGRTLDAALHALVTEFDHASPLTASIAIEGTPTPLPPAVAMTLYRAVQEGLTNAQKYTSGQQVQVTVRYEPAQVTLRVQDNGTVATASNAGGGFGLLGLRERVSQLGGTLRAEPSVAGFVVEVVVPDGKRHGKNKEQ